MSLVPIIGRTELPLNAFSVSAFLRTEETVQKQPSREEQVQGLMSEVSVRPFKTSKEGIEYKLRTRYAPTYNQILDTLGIPQSMRGKQLPPELKAKVREMQRTIGRGRRGAMSDSDITSFRDAIYSNISGLRAGSEASANTFFARLQIGEEVRLPRLAQRETELHELLLEQLGRYKTARRERQYSETTLRNISDRF